MKIWILKGPSKTKKVFDFTKKKNRKTEGYYAIASFSSKHDVSADSRKKKSSNLQKHDIIINHFEVEIWEVRKFHIYEWEPLYCINDRFIYLTF